MLVLFFIASICAIATTSPAASAAIGGERVAVLVPFSNGATTGAESPSNHPAYATGFGFGWDVHGGTSTPVYPRVATGDGVITMKVVNISPSSSGAGSSVDVEVRVDNTVVGTLRYGHLTNIGVESGNTVSSGTRLGDTAPNQSVTNSSGTCVGYPCSGGWQVHSATGVHVHMEFKKACYGPQGISTWVGASTGIALLSQNYSNSNKTSCDASELSSVASVQPPPPPSSQTGQGTGNAIFWGNGRLDVFVMGTNATGPNLYQNTFENGSWSGWGIPPYSTNERITSTPAVISRGSGMLDLFARGEDGELLQKRYDSNGWHWWEALGGCIVGSPSVTRWGSRLDVFAQGCEATGSNLYQKVFQNGSWGGWGLHANRITSPPAAISIATNRIDVFARSETGALFHKWYVPDPGWQVETLSGSIVGAPAVTSWSSTRIDVFAMNTNTTGANMSQKTFIKDVGWSAWGVPPPGTDGTRITAVLGAVTRGTDMLDVFARSEATGELLQKRYNSSGWHVWESLGISVSP